jgi:hypothetical protein
MAAQIISELATSAIGIVIGNIISDHIFTPKPAIASAECEEIPLVEAKEEIKSDSFITSAYNYFSSSKSDTEQKNDSKKETSYDYFGYKKITIKQISIFGKEAFKYKEETYFK